MENGERIAQIIPRKQRVVAHHRISRGAANTLAVDENGFAYGNGCEYWADCLTCPFDDCRCPVNKFNWGRKRRKQNVTTFGKK